MPDSGPVPECSACGTSRLELSERIAALRSVLVDSINALECSFASPEVSDAFLANLPAEIKGQIEGKNARIAALEAELATQAHAAMRAQERAEAAESQACRMREALTAIRMLDPSNHHERRTTFENAWNIADATLAASGPCPHQLQLGKLEVEIVELRQREAELIEKSEKWRAASEKGAAEVEQLKATNHEIAGTLTEIVIERNALRGELAEARKLCKRAEIVIEKNQ